MDSEKPVRPEEDRQEGSLGDTADNAHNAPKVDAADPEQRATKTRKKTRKKRLVAAGVLIVSAAAAAVAASQAGHIFVRCTRADVVWLRNIVNSREAMQKALKENRRQQGLAANKTTAATHKRRADLLEQILIKQDVVALKEKLQKSGMGKSDIEYIAKSLQTAKVTTKPKAKTAKKARR